MIKTSCSRYALLFFIVAVCVLPPRIYATQWPAERDVEGLTLIAPSTLSAPQAFADWTVLWSPGLASPALAFGPPVSTPSDKADDVLSLVKNFADSRAEFELVRSSKAGRLQRDYFREIRQGLPVLAGRADLVRNQRGQLMRWSLRAHEQWLTTDGHFLGMLAAAAALAAALRPAEWRANMSLSFAAWLPDYDSRSLRPVYWIHLEGNRPDERWEGIVDAVSGEIIMNWPGIRTDVISGTVQGPYWQPYIQSDVQIGPHAFESVIVNNDSLITDSAAHFSIEAGNAAALVARLKGPWVNVQNDDGPDGRLEMDLTAPFSPLTWTWPDTSATHAELNLFHHVNFIHGWYKVLDPAYDALDYPMPAVGDYGTAYDNAFWNGHGIYFGSGSLYQNFAMFSDVIYHEYTHGVTDGIYPNGMLPYTGQPGAMNEAWSDYIGCTINGDPLEAEWIGGFFGSYFRNLQSTMVFPRDWHGEVHDDSPFISAPLWTIRTALGAPMADSIAHFARYALSETFFDYLVAVLETDDDDGDLSNGTPHGLLIYNAFGDHGIGPGDMPILAVHNLTYMTDGQNGSIGDGDRYVEQGETVALVFDVANDAPLFPQPAHDVQISVHTADSRITIENGSQTVEVLGPGQSHAVTPVHLQIGSAAPDHWALLQVDVTSNGDSATFHTEFEFSVGTPHVLVVDDDPGSMVDTFITAALHGRDRIFDRLQVAAGGSVPADSLPYPGLVIWLSGNADGNVLTTEDRLLIQNYIGGGNRVLLSGQNLADSLQGTWFAQNVLHAQIQSNGLIGLTATATHSPLTPNEWYILTGSHGAGNQTSQASFVPQEGSTAIANYAHGVPGPVSAIEFADAHGLLFGFGIEAISGMAAGSTSLAGFFDDIYAWAGDVLPVEPTVRPHALPLTWSLGPAYPNPFNSAASLAYSIPSPLGAELLIFDLTGREVERRHLNTGSGTLAWRPRTASGVYFACIAWNGGQTKPVKLLYLR